MAYTATVIPIMIASPGDVTDEREAVRQIIHDWNDVNSENAKVILVAVGWETHSSPELGSRPQELINTRILNRCDLLIGVFWTRLGTPTGKAMSGTVEEIEEHVAANKPAMIYFSSKPVAPDSIDPEQYKLVKEAKESWKKRGLLETYDSLEEFRNKLSKQLQFCLSKNEHLQKIISENVSGTDSVEPSEFDLINNLSDEAKTILNAAASRSDGRIQNISFIGGKGLSAGGQSFGSSKGRDAAKWENALSQLESNGFIIARGQRREIFELTHQGWQAADAISKSDPSK